MQKFDYPWESFYITHFKIFLKNEGENLFLGFSLENWKFEKWKNDENQEFLRSNLSEKFHFLKIEKFSGDIRPCQFWL